MHHRVIEAQESDIDEQNDIDALLDASLHEQQVLWSSISLDDHYHQYSSTFLKSEEGLTAIQNTLDHRDHRDHRVTTPPIDQVSIRSESLVEENSSRPSRFGVEVEVFRRDSTVSIITLNEIEEEMEHVNRNDGALSSPPKSILQTSDHSRTNDPSSVCPIRRSSGSRGTRRRRGSISFSEHVDTVTYDKESWTTETSEMSDLKPILRSAPSLSAENEHELQTDDDKSGMKKKKKKKKMLPVKFLRRKQIRK